MRSVPLSASAAVALLLSVVLGVSSAPPPKDKNVVDADPLKPEDELKSFHLPQGFEAQLVASEPDIHKPLNMAFDDRGRLWVSETVEYPFPASPDGKLKHQDAVKVLEDFGPDGKARKITTFADQLDIPIGILPLNNPKPQEALSFSIPFISRLRDTKGEGKADERTVLYGQYGFRDTHGMTNSFTWGFDGWVYASHGYSNESTIKGADDKAVTMQSGNVYRLRADGSHLEYFTHGQVNPFGICFDPLGNVYSADCETKPITMLLRGGYYSSFGKPHDGLGFAPNMIDRYDDSSAIAGLGVYAADHFPASYRGNVFIGDVVTNRINEFRLTWHGSTPEAKKFDFLKSDDRWFRPVAITVGPDGALYVADFYNRIIGHYEVPLDHPGRDHERGRIWRIVYRDADGKGPPPAPPRADWTKASVAELMKDLGHPNLTVRIKATNELAERGGKEGIEAVKAVMRSADKPADGDTWRRMHGLWVLDRCGALDDAILTAAAKDKENGVRVHAQRVLAERAKWTAEQHDLALAGLKDADATVQRCAADALARHPDPANLRPLLDLRHAVPPEDTHLLYVARMALRDQLLLAAAWDKLPLKPWTESDAQAVADVSLGVHSPEAAAYLMRTIPSQPGAGDFLTRAVHEIARYGSPETTKTLLTFVRGHQPEDLGLQFALFREVQHGLEERKATLDDDARAWAVQLTDKLLASKQAPEVKSGIEMVGVLRLEGLQSRLAQLATDRGTPEDQRAAALKALRDVDAVHNAAVLGRVLNDAEAPAALRDQTATLLAEANQAETQAELIQALPTAPAHLQNVIAAGLSNSRNGAEKLLDAVEAGKASARLLQERIVEVRLADKDVKDRVVKLTKGLKPAEQAVQELLAKRRQGFDAAKPDVAIGAKLFEKNCAICHQLGGKGAKVGPQLDGVGIRGLDRLLEDVLDPNRNVDQAFRLTTLLLKKGGVVSGLLLREEGEVLVMADAQGKEVRVPKGEVDERATSPQSPMPADFADKVSEADFYHLMGFLLAQRAKDAPKPGG